MTVFIAIVKELYAYYMQLPWREQVLWACAGIIVLRIFFRGAWFLLEWAEYQNGVAGILTYFAGWIFLGPFMLAACMLLGPFTGTLRRHYLVYAEEEPEAEPAGDEPPGKTEEA